MDILTNLKTGVEDLLHLENLSSIECQVIILEVKRRGLAVERVGCWQGDGTYHNIHDFERFTEDYLIPLDGWEMRAFEQLLLTYEKTVLRRNPTNLPRFELLVTRGYDPELKKATERDLERLRNDPDFTPKNFYEYDAPIGIEIE